MRHIFYVIVTLSILKCAETGIQGNVLLKDTYPVSALSEVTYGWGYSSLTLKETYNKVVDVTRYLTVSLLGPKSTFLASNVLSSEGRWVAYPAW